MGIIDEAFKSRIHMCLYYPPLTREQYTRIFDVNLERVIEIGKANSEAGEPMLNVDEVSIRKWAETHYDTTPEYVGRWNGRQIRNAFQIGASLAYYDLLEKKLDDKDRVYNSQRGWLNSSQFEAMAVATKKFDEYMIGARKGSDDFIARKERTRDDPPMTAVSVNNHEGIRLRTPVPRPGHGYYPQGRPQPEPSYKYRPEPSRLRGPPQPEPQYYQTTSAPYYPPPDQEPQNRRPQDAYPSPSQDPDMAMSYGRDRHAAEEQLLRRPTAGPEVGPGHGSQSSYSPAKATLPSERERMYQPMPPPPLEREHDGYGATDHWMDAGRYGHLGLLSAQGYGG